MFYVRRSAKGKLVRPGPEHNAIRKQVVWWFLEGHAPGMSDYKSV